MSKRYLSVVEAPACGALAQRSQETHTSTYCVHPLCGAMAAAVGHTHPFVHTVGVSGTLASLGTPTSWRRSSLPLGVNIFSQEDDHVCVAEASLSLSAPRSGLQRLPRWLGPDLSLNKLDPTQRDGV